MKLPRHRRGAFTLMELLLGMVIGTMILAACAGVFATAVRSWEQGARKTDVLQLANFFLEKFATQHAKNVKRIATPAIDMLMAYHWPGNVRELENAIERAVVVCNEQVLRAHHLPPTLQTAEETGTVIEQSLEQATEAFEKDILQDALKSARGNRAKAADAPAHSMKDLQLQISANGRHFVDQRGEPFFYLGDTCWLLFQRPNREELDEYLKDRVAKGFTVMQAYVIRGLGKQHPDGNSSLLNATPFIDRDPTRPNEESWIWNRRMRIIPPGLASRALTLTRCAPKPIWRCSPAQPGTATAR